VRRSQWENPQFGPSKVIEEQGAPQGQNEQQLGENTRSEDAEGDGVGFGCGCGALMAGCGGGGSGEKDCSDFSYQQDAQAWHNSHSNSDLDRDGDGIACESLPSRPGGSGGGTAAQNMTLPSVVIFDLSGEVASIARDNGFYKKTTLSVDTSGGSSLNGNHYSDGRFALSGSSGVEYMLDYGGADGYPARNMRAREPGYAWPADSTVSSLISSPGGVYHFMGKRCVASGCAMVYGELSVDNASRTVAVCQGGPLSGCGASTQRFSFTSSYPETDMPGVFKLRGVDGTSPGLIAFGTSAQGAIGVSFVSQDRSKARISAFVGKASVTYRITDSLNVPYHSITSSGTSAQKYSGVLGIGAINDQPLPGFFRLTGNAAALNMIASPPVRVLAYDGVEFQLWLN